jgi:hypothetical protein
MVIDILRNCPLNHKLYSTACGDLKFTGMSNSIIHTHSDRFNKDIDFDEDGRLYLFDGCVSDITLLYPARGNHMWSNWRDVMFSEGDFIFDEVNTKEVYIFSNYDNFDKVFVRNMFGESMLMPTNHFRFASRIEKTNFCSRFVADKPFERTEEEEEYKFEVFDKVLVRDDDNDVWKASFYSHPWTSQRGTLFHFTTGCDTSGYLQCIPYNDRTKHLVGTTNKPN